MPDKKLPLSYIHEPRKYVFIKRPENQIRECPKAKEIAEKGEKVSEKLHCLYFAVLNHKGVCVGNRKQRRGEGCQ